MTSHQIMVLYTGSMYVMTGLVGLVAWKVLGPRYADRLTIGWKLRAVIFVFGIGAIARGMIIIFPGRLVHNECMSPVLPIWSTILLLATVSATEFIASHRAPPPVIERIQAAFAIMTAHHDAQLAEAAMLLPTAAFGERPPGEPKPQRLTSPSLRRWVLAAAVLGLVLICAFVLHAAAAELQR